MLLLALLIMLASAKNFDPATVKHALQNIQMIATSGFLTDLECIKFRFRPAAALCPGRHWQWRIYHSVTWAMAPFEL